MVSQAALLIPDPRGRLAVVTAEEAGDALYGWTTYL